MFTVHTNKAKLRRLLLSARTQPSFSSRIRLGWRFGVCGCQNRLIDHVKYVREYLSLGTEKKKIKQSNVAIKILCLIQFHNQWTGPEWVITRPGVEKKEQRASLGSRPASLNSLSAACRLFCTLWDEKEEEPETQCKPSSTRSGRVCVCGNYASCANTQEHTHMHTAMDFKCSTFYANEEISHVTRKKTS